MGKGLGGGTLGDLETCGPMRECVIQGRGPPCSWTLCETSRNREEAEAMRLPQHILWGCTGLPLLRLLSHPHWTLGLSTGSQDLMSPGQSGPGWRTVFRSHFSHHLTCCWGLADFFQQLLSFHSAG
jgi:hypothetical protein